MLDKILSRKENINTLLRDGEFVKELFDGLSLDSSILLQSNLHETVNADIIFGVDPTSMVISMVLAELLPKMAKEKDIKLTIVEKPIVTNGSVSFQVPEPIKVNSGVTLEDLTIDLRHSINKVAEKVLDYLSIAAKEGTGEIILYTATVHNIGSTPDQPYVPTAILNLRYTIIRDYLDFKSDYKIAEPDPTGDMVKVEEPLGDMELV